MMVKQSNLRMSSFVTVTTDNSVRKLVQRNEELDYVPCTYTCATMSSHNSKYYAKKIDKKNFCKVQKLKKKKKKQQKTDILFKQQLINSQSDSHTKSEELITSHIESEEIWKDGDDEESTAKVCNESSTGSNEDFWLCDKLLMTSVIMSIESISITKL
jgi:hypothetical protein